MKRVGLLILLSVFLYVSGQNTMAHNVSYEEFNKEHDRRLVKEYMHVLTRAIDEVERLLRHTSAPFKPIVHELVRILHSDPSYHWLFNPKFTSEHFDGRLYTGKEFEDFTADMRELPRAFKKLIEHEYRKHEHVYQLAQYYVCFARSYEDKAFAFLERFKDQKHSLLLHAENLNRNCPFWFLPKN